MTDERCAVLGIEVFGRYRTAPDRGNHPPARDRKGGIPATEPVTKAKPVTKVDPVTKVSDAPRGRGCPRVGDAAMTAAERMRRMRAKRNPGS